MPVNIKEDIEIFLNKRYAAINRAYQFEREKPKVSLDDAGNRPKIAYRFLTGQFTEGFGEWYQDYLAKIFGKENVVCDFDTISEDHPSERVFCFSIYGSPDALLQKALWWETQGIEKSDKNESQLRDLLRHHADVLFDGHKVKDVFITGLFNRLVVDFEKPFETNDIGYEVFKHAQEKLRLNRGLVMVRNRQDRICQFWLELDKVEPVDVLRTVSRAGFRLASYE